LTATPHISTLSLHDALPISSAIALPLTGWLSSQWGRRKVFIVSVVGFTLASALCGLASSLEGIVAARLLQGVFGAALVPLSQTVDRKSTRLNSSHSQISYAV